MVSMRKTIAIIAVCIFIGVGIFAFNRALVQFQANKSLSWKIDNDLKPRVSHLEQEYKQLEKQKSQLVDELAKKQNTIIDLEQENAVIVETLQKKNAVLQEMGKERDTKENELNKLTNQYDELQAENDILKEKITAMFLELRQMRETLSSARALRERLRDLKDDTKENDTFGYANDLNGQDLASAGNGGFLIRNGKSTYNPKIKIRVTPVKG